MQNIMIDKPVQDQEVEVVLKKNTVKQTNPISELQRRSLNRAKDAAIYSRMKPFYKNENSNLMLDNKKLTR